MNCGLGLEVPSGLGCSAVLKGLGVLARNSFLSIRHKSIEVLQRMGFGG
jgi:hypothetical protein